MIRHVNIPHVSDGEPITQGLMDQLVRGANSARAFTGDDTVAATQIGGNMAVYDPRTQIPRDQGVFVQIEPWVPPSRTTNSVGAVLHGGFYGGYVLSHRQEITVGDESQPINNINVINNPGFDPGFGPGDTKAPGIACYVVNTTEFNFRTSLILSRTWATGRYMGTFKTLPLIVVTVQTFNQSVIVEVTGTESGGGKYYGKIHNLAAKSGLSGTGNLATTDFPSSGTGLLTNALIFNMKEIGASTHDLTVGSSTMQTYFPGIIIGQTSDFRPVVAIDGIQTLNCT